MGWQTLSGTLRRWDSGSSSREVEAAAEELLSSGRDEETLQLFSEALEPSLSRDSHFLTKLSKTEGAKCRCDAVWYGDTIAYGCKTCGLSSASCICVFCFDAGDHEGHDFYISRSDYGCCDCGDAYAWRQSGFCRHHPGPRKEIDPAQLLPEATRERARVLIPLQVRRLARFQPEMQLEVTCPPCRPSSSSSSQPLSRRVVSLDTSDTQDPHPTSETGGARGDAQSSRATEGPADGDADDNLNSSASTVPPQVLVTGVNLRVTEEMLREFFVKRIAAITTASTEGGEVEIDERVVQRVDLVRDADTKASKGRAYVTFRDATALTAASRAHGEVLRGSPLRIHASAEAIFAAERHLQAWETHFEWLLHLGGFHDGLRKIIGQVFLDDTLLGQQSATEALLSQSHLLEPSVRKLETNLMVDLMLDLDFKHRFAQVFTRLYHKLVLARAGNQDTNELGDFTCQIFTRQDVTLELVLEHDLVKNLLGCLWDLLQPALVQGAVPAVFSHESNIFRDHEIIQCSMDLLYVLDHAEVAREIVSVAKLRSSLWEGWIRILIAMQAMNAHERRTLTHVEFANPAWGNALTLHTDLMSNTWLILDAVESKADLTAVQDMARATWAELRLWMLRVHFAENRTSQEGLEGIMEYRVSGQPVSFHVPVNRVLALLLHHLCLRSQADRGDTDSVAPQLHGRAALWTILGSVGLTREVDVLWWMEHPLRAIVLHSQVSAGMWRRNGEALENECEFYRMNYWHHLLIDMDLLILRMSSMVLAPATFFRTLLLRFELPSWLSPGNPVAAIASAASGVPGNDEFATQKLQSLVLLLHQLLAVHTPHALTFREMVTQTTRQYLSIGPKSHSQLWDPRLERSTATSTAKDQQMLESALREISNFSAADGAGHSSAKYHLKDDQWGFVDPYFHLFSWGEQQKAEENILAALKARRETIMKWVEESARLQPKPFEVYHDAFYDFCTCALVQALCWLLLVRLAFTHLKDNGAVADGRLLVLVLHLALRSAQAPLRHTDEMRPWDQVVCLGDEEVQIFAVAAAMDTHIATSARRRFRVSTAAFFSPQLRSFAAQDAVTEETEVTLLDAVERLALSPEEQASGGLARGLQARLLQDPQNCAVLGRTPRPWFAPEPPACLQQLQARGQAAASEEGGNEGASRDQEARKAKRRKAAQERQQRMLDDLKKRQNAFMNTEQGKNMLEEAGQNAIGSQNAECVVCMSKQEGENGDNPIGILCFLRPAVASCLPRERVPPESAVLLQAPKSPVAAAQGSRGPLCFSPTAPDGLVLARACSHRMHFVCWRRFRPAGLANNSGRLSCPYCGTVVNALLPAASSADIAAMKLDPEGRMSTELPASALSLVEEDVDVEIGPSPAGYPSRTVRRHADASMDFAEQLSLQLRKLCPPAASHASSSSMERPVQTPQHLLQRALGYTVDAPLFSQTFFSLTRLCADNVSLAEVRWRTRRSSGAFAGPCSPAGASPIAAGCSGLAGSAVAEAVLQSIATEALQGAPRMAESITALALSGAAGLETPRAEMLTRALAEATPQGRFQMLTSLLLGLCTEPATDSPQRWDAACALLRVFYVTEVLAILSALGTQELFESELARTVSIGCTSGSAIWQHLCSLNARGSDATRDGSPAGELLPLKTREEAAGVLKLSLNPFIAKARILLSLLYEGQEDPLLSISLLGPSPLPDDEHHTLACAALGLPDIDELLFGFSAASPAETSATEHVLANWYGYARSPSLPSRISSRGGQPSAPVLFVLVSDSTDPPSIDDVEPPPHVWQITEEGFDRLVATNRNEVVQLETPVGMRGKLFCVVCRLTLPVITGRVYQRFYTQFVHARCTVCRTSPPIPTLCLLCGTFLCCNSECCRRPGADPNHMLGEVTHHAQSCGFGTCVFLQLSNSLVHIVTDGYIACWGSLYLDGHGEEEYNLARPLHISEARLQQLTQSVREVSFDFEPRLKWKKVIFV